MNKRIVKLIARNTLYLKENLMSLLMRENQEVQDNYRSSNPYASFKSFLRHV